MKKILDQTLSVLDWIVEHILVTLIIGLPSMFLMIYIFDHSGNIWINTLSFGLGMCSIWCLAKVARNWIRNK